MPTGHPTQNLIERFLQGDRIALARAISLIENEADGYRELLRAVRGRGQNAYLLGITGPPGAGKSTLVSHLAARAANEGANVGVIAVDPTSPFTGGALLGDRIRMQELAGNERVFIRSMATRGSLGGLAKATGEVAAAMAAFGLDPILIETVGVGQSELDVASSADTVVVVVVPESGDAVQAMKAGLMEIADVLVVNKADREGADLMARELRVTLDLKKDDGWRPPVVLTVATEDRGVAEVAAAVAAHRAYLSSSGELARRRAARVRREIETLINDDLHRRMRAADGYERHVAEAVRRVERGEITTYDAAAELIAAMFGPSKR